MSKLKVLFFAANPLATSRLQIGREAREIEQEVGAALHRDNVEFRSHWATRVADLRRELLRRDPQIVHFSGHGGAEGLILETADGRGAHPVDAAALKEFFEAFRGQIRVVVLNACHSRAQAQAIAEAVGCAIGTPSQIEDEAAIAFSTAFYSSIAFGQSVQAAFDQARSTLKMDHFDESQRPVLACRKDVDPAHLVLITPLSIIDPAPPRRLASRLVTALVLIGAAVFAITSVWPPRDRVCERAREAGRAAIAAGAARPQGLLSRPNDPLAGPRELVEAKEEHRAGDHAAEFALLRQAAEGTSVVAWTELGLAFLNGDGVAVQPDSGRDWLRKAAQKKYPRAMRELANSYVRGDAGDRNLDRYAVDWYQQAAQLGDPEAMFNLAGMYRDGRGTGVDSALALQWYERAAAKGLVEALVMVGSMYEQGLAVAPDQRQALCWYKAAEDVSAPGADSALARVKGR